MEWTESDAHAFLFGGQRLHPTQAVPSRYPMPFNPQDEGLIDAYSVVTCWLLFKTGGAFATDEWKEARSAIYGPW